MKFDRDKFMAQQFLSDVRGSVNATCLFFEFMFYTPCFIMTFYLEAFTVYASISCFVLFKQVSGYSSSHGIPAMAGSIYPSQTALLDQTDSWNHRPQEISMWQPNVEVTSSQILSKLKVDFLLSADECACAVSLFFYRDMFQPSLITPKCVALALQPGY